MARSGLSGLVVAFWGPGRALGRAGPSAARAGKKTASGAGVHAGSIDQGGEDHEPLRHPDHSISRLSPPMSTIKSSPMVVVCDRSSN